MAEIEHFVDPMDKSHPKFCTVADIELPLWSAPAQENNEREPVMIKIGEAVSSGMVGNETVGYFVARTFLFLTSLGVKGEAIRFR